MIERPVSATDKMKFATGAVTLRQDAADHLADAFEQMDLLLSARSVDAGLVFLVALLHHLQAMRRLL